MGRAGVRAADVDAVEWALACLRDAGVMPRSVLVLSPAWDAHGTGVSESVAIERVWPGVRTIEADRGRWDLDGAMPDDGLRADVGVICNTFMCSRDPAAWLEHLSAAVPILVMQDLASSRRASDGSHCAVETGDVARYSASSHGVVGESDPGRNVFDVSTCGRSVIDARGYLDDGAMKVVAVLRIG